MKQKILGIFKDLEDPRMKGKILHPMENIIFIALTAVICGAETWEDIHLFGKSKKDWLSTFLDLKNGIPSQDTFNRFFQALKPKSFNDCVLKWVKKILQDHDTEFISIDGKSIRTASKMIGDEDEDEHDNIHIVSAWASNAEISLAQEKTSKKSNEITAIPNLLDILDLKKCIVTIDAMGCQKKIAAKIIEEKGDYILALKENHEILYNDVLSSFSLLKPADQIEKIDAGHGRVETRKYFVITNLKYITQKEQWKSLQSIIAVESERFFKKTGESTSYIRYYLSSVTDINQISEGIRAHWGIENKVHWVLDVTMNEDHSCKRAGNAAQNFSLLNKWVLNLLRKSPDKVSLRGKRKKAGWDNDYLLSVLKLIFQVE